MIIDWVYLVLTLTVLWLGLDILRQKRGGLHAWKQPYGYKISYYKGKAAQIVGAILTIFGLVFTVGAVRLLLGGNAIPVFFYGFCFGSIIIIVGVNVYLRKYAE